MSLHFRHFLTNLSESLSEEKYLSECQMHREGLINHTSTLHRNFLSFFSVNISIVFSSQFRLRMMRVPVVVKPDKVAHIENENFPRFNYGKCQFSFSSPSSSARSLQFPSTPTVLFDAAEQMTSLLIFFARSSPPPHLHKVPFPHMTKDKFFLITKSFRFFIFSTVALQKVEKKIQIESNRKRCIWLLNAKITMTRHESILYHHDVSRAAPQAPLV